VLASKLAAAGKSVVVLEQGPAYDLAERKKILATKHARVEGGGLSVDFNDGLSEDYRNAAVQNAGKEEWGYSSQAGVGGSALHWAAGTPRPRKDDLQVRSLFGYGRDWPIAYEKLEPWLLRAEHELGVAGNDDNPYASPRSGPFPMPAHVPTPFERDVFAPAARSLGWTAHSCPWAINSVARDGRPACQRCRDCWHCPSGAKYTPDLSHMARFRAEAQAQLITECKLTRLETSADGAKIVAAHALKRDGSEAVIRAKTYVLAMGGVEVPRMLMLTTGKRHEGGLGNQGGKLGVGLGDHLLLPFSIVLKQPVQYLRGFTSMTSDHFREKSARENHGTFFMLFQATTPSWLIREHATRGDKLSLTALRASVVRSLEGVLIVETACANTLDLHPDAKDAFGNKLPRISATLLDRERASMDQAARVIRNLALAMNADAVDTAWDHGYKGWASHPSGTTAMGRTPDDGVCNTDLRVFGLENLYLVSSSVFPHQGAANPTLTIVALSLRLAAHLGAA
jgi:choline dehydrogenase-like flavoprotein